ncbi:signal peptidase I [Chloroflexota bacterium]
MGQRLIYMMRNRNVQRALTLFVIVALCLGGFMAVRGVMPFMPVFGTSMEPVLNAGNMIVVQSMPPEEVKEGDIIVYNVPPAIQDYYNYPPVVAHRVIEVRDTDYGIAWRTAGDNAGEDPFTVRANDLRGTVNYQVPYLGFPLLFLQSKQGMTFVIISLLLFAFYLYAGDLGRSGQKVHRGVFAPVIEESQRGSQVISQRLETTEKQMEYTQQALTSFASAIAEYAEHLKSHTSAIQGLSEASHELKKGAAEQNKVLQRLAEVMEQPGLIKEEVTPSVTEPPKTEVKKVTYPPGCARSRLQHTSQDEIFQAG